MIMNPDYEKGDEMKLYNKYKKTIQRIISFTAAVTMMLASMPMNEVSEEAGDLFSTYLSARAEGALDDLIAKYPGNAHTFDSGDSRLVEYSQCFADATFAEDHKNDVLRFIPAGGDFFVCASGYAPIGTEDSPFSGTIYFNTTNSMFGIESEVPLFNCVSDSVKLYQLDTTTTVGLTFKRTSDVPSGERRPLFANYVKGTAGNTTAANWNITLDSGNGKGYSGVIGSLINNARVNLSFTDNSSTGSPHRIGDDIDDGSRIDNKKNDTNVGILCGDILGGSVLTASYTHSGDIYICGNEASYSGGLVGNIEGTGSIFELTSGLLPKIILDTIKDRGGLICGNTNGGTVILPNDLTISGTVKGTYAGGLIGYCKDTAIQLGTSDSGSASLSNCSIDGSTGAGAIFGYYESADSANDSILNNSYTVSGCEIKGGAAGGVAGEYKNNYAATTLDVSKFTFTSNSRISAGTVGGGVIGKYTAGGDLTITSTANDNSFTPPASSISFGGVIGEYTSLDLKNTLSVTNIDVNGLSCSASGGVGGIVRNITNSSYLAVADVSVTNASADNALYFGGIVSYLDDTNAGSFIDVTGDFTLSLASGKTYKGGAIAGSFKNGVIRLAETTDISGAKAANGYAQLVYENDNTLVYAKGSGSDANWTLVRNAATTASDLGQWGEVVRLVGGNDLETAGIVTIGTGDDLHKVTLAKTTTSASGTAGFVKLALNMQLNDGVDHGSLCFESGGITKTTLLSSSTTINLSGTAELSGTGILGLMRDGGNGCYYDVNNTQNNSAMKGSPDYFTGTITGSNAEIKLAIGESYGTGNANGGKVYLSHNNGHSAQGLLSFADGATISGITVSGTMDVERVDNAGDALHMGAVMGYMTNGATLTDVSVSTDMDFTRTHQDGRIYIGGVAGLFDGDNTGTLRIIGGTSTTPKGSIAPIITLHGSQAAYSEDNYSNRNTYTGGILGLLGGKTSSQYGMEIKYTDVSPKIKLDSTVANVNYQYCGGMIGRVRENTTNERTIKIDTVTMTSAEVEQKSIYSGGLLGTMWDRTQVTIDGLTVSGTSSDKTKVTNKHSGQVKLSGLVFRATGKWDVNSLSISDTDFSATGTNADSFGLIVNEGYRDNDGLYLNLKNSGYTLTDVTVPTSNNNNYFVDAIVADTKNNSKDNGDILVGGNGTGIISINMNTTGGTDTKVSDTGTYQNRISSLLNDKLIANQNSRYYYNLDEMLSKGTKGSSAPGGEKFLLWSVRRYAAGNIKGYFKDNDNMVSETSIDLSGLSYYPIDISDVTLPNSAVVTLDYSGIKAKEDTTSPDGWDRDPLHKGNHKSETARNQHYLMQTGLFRNTGGFSAKNLTVKGDFGYIDGVASGALINGQSTGNFIITGLTLDGLAPSNANSALIVNRVNGEGTNISNITLSTVRANGYSATNTQEVAASLFGSAKGQNLTMSFSDIKLDARNGDTIPSSTGWTTAAATAMNTAYGTTRSIFSNAIFFSKLEATDNCTLEYNYTVEEDWGDGSEIAPRNVTYGKEITKSLQYEDGEKRYNVEGTEKGRFTNPVSNSDSEFSFEDGFLPYVANYEEKGVNQDYPVVEIKVNYKVVIESSGCGTYNDPYVISDAAGLQFMADIINGKTINAASLILPNERFADYVSLSWDSGNDHSEYFRQSDGTYKNANNKTWSQNNIRAYYASAYFQITRDIELTSAFEGIGTPNDASGYKGNYVFHGVIVGKGSTAPKITNPTNNPFIVVSNGSVVKNLKIENTGSITRTQSETGNNALYGYNGSTTDAKYYGGVIGEIMGGDNIIDDVTVTFTGSTTLDGTYAHVIAEGGMVGAVVNGALIFRGLNTVSGRSVSGGGIYSNPIVGRVINGYAIYEKIEGRTGTAPANGNNYHIDTIDRSNTNKLDVNYTNLTINVPDAQALYIMSLITQSIAGTANTNDDTEYGESSPSYGYYNYITGVTRLGDYTDVGTNKSSDQVSDYSGFAVNDSVNNGANQNLLKSPVPYIIYNYTEKKNDTKTRLGTKYPARKMTSDDSKFWTVTLSTDDSFADFNNFKAFRGIGSSCIKNNRVTMKVAKFDGNGNTISLDMKMIRYTRDQDNFFHRYATSIKQEYAGTELSGTYGADGNNNDKLLGFGLFDTIKCSTSSNNKNVYPFTNFTLSGNIFEDVYLPSGEIATDADMVYIGKSGNSRDSQMQLFATGGVVGISREGYCNFENIILDGVSMRSTYSCGGLLGLDIEKNGRTLRISGCRTTQQGISIVGGFYGNYNESKGSYWRHGVGSFIGMTIGSRVSIDGKTDENDYSNLYINRLTTSYTGTYRAHGSSDTNADWGQNRCNVGGLIGYTGMGAEIKNIKLIGSGTDAYIGSSADYSQKSANAAGLVGFAQRCGNRVGDSGLSSWEYDHGILIDNCTIENINIRGMNTAGGFYGHSWDGDLDWCTGVIEITNSKLVGTDLNNMPEIKATLANNNNYYAGGLCAGATTRYLPATFNNCYVEGYKIEGWHVGGIAGVATGYSTVGNTNITNCFVKDCDIISNQHTNNSTGGSGGLIGYATKNLYGYNLAIYNVNFSKASVVNNITGTLSDNTSNAGALIGNNSSSLVDKLVGIGTYHTDVSKVPSSVVKTNGTNAGNFFVYADYLNASSTDITSKSGNKSTFNATNNVEQPKAPYVTVNPRMGMGIGEFITSDGAGVGVAGAIYAEAIKTTGKSNRAYNTWVNTKGLRSGNKTDKEILSKYINTDGTYKNGVFRISDFETEFAGVEGIENVDNFAMLVVNNDADLAGDITPFIKSYIRMVTNTTSPTTGTAGEGAYSNFDNNSGKTYSVIIRPCSYNSTHGKFELGTAGEQGLTVHSGGDDNGKYEVSTPDSTKENQFSLIDIQFKDPTDTSASPKIAYHLYVPVLTQKTMSVNYYSASVSGTTYLPLTYTNRINSELAANKTQTNLVESTGAWTTTFIRYEYPKNEVRSNYAWNHSKKLTLKIDSNFHDLPRGTKLILVDPNNNKDSAYTYTFDSAVGKGTDYSLSLSDFVDESGDHFKEQNLNTLLSNQSGQRGNDNIVYENYYISMYIPKTEGKTHLVRFESQSPLDVDVAAGEEKPENAAKASVEQKLITYVVAGDLYTHTIERLSVDSNQHNTEMTSANNTLTVETQAKIILNDVNAGIYLANAEILHSFYISLTSYESDGGISDYIKGIVQTDINSSGTSVYTDSTGSQNESISPIVRLGGNYVEIKTGDIKHMLLNGDHTATISTTTNMEFYDVTAFPYKTPEQVANETSNIGSVVGIKSNIAYDSTDLPYSPITAKNKDGVSNPDTKYYYTTTQNFADLSFNAVPTDDTEDEIGYKTNNRSLLGVNGKYGASPQLTAKSVYNVSRIVDYDFASDIQYTVKLWKKQLGNDGITRYVQVNNISEYLSNVELVDSEVSLEKISDGQNEYIYKGAIDHNNQKDQDRKFEADFKCRVKTSETSKREYANYKIEVTAELINATNTKRMDYIVYTNALIDPEVIPEN